MTPATETKPIVPFYINQPCGTCSARVGPDGVWVSDNQRWCRDCARGLMSLLVLLLGGGS